MPGRLPMLPGRVVGRFRFPRFGRSPPPPGRLPMLPGKVVGRFTFPRLGRSPPPPGRLPMLPGKVVGRFTFPRFGRSPPPPGRLPMLPGSVDGRFTFPRFGRLPPAIPPLGNEGRLTGFTLLGGRTDGRFATAEPPGRVVGRDTFGRPPPDGEKPPPDGREILLGRETLAIEGRFGLGREAAGRDIEGRLPPRRHPWTAVRHRRRHVPLMAVLRHRDHHRVHHRRRVHAARRRCPSTQSRRRSPPTL